MGFSTSDLRFRPSAAGFRVVHFQSWALRLGLCFWFQVYKRTLLKSFLQWIGFTSSWSVKRVSASIIRVIRVSEYSSTSSWLG